MTTTEAWAIKGPDNWLDVFALYKYSPDALNDAVRWSRDTGKRYIVVKVRVRITEVRNG